MYANHAPAHPPPAAPYPLKAYPAHTMHPSVNTLPIIMYKPPTAEGEPPPPPPPTLPAPKHKVCRILQYDAERMAKRLKRKHDGETTYDFYRLTSAILLNQLKNTEAISALYAANDNQPTVDLMYEPADEAQQAAALELMRAHSLDEDREKPRADKQWTIMWKQASTKDRPRGVSRLLLQCPCGYRHASKFHPSVFAYTGCLAHVEITTEGSTKTVLRIRGHLDHNAACVETKARVAQAQLEQPDGPAPRKRIRKRKRKAAPATVPAVEEATPSDDAGVFQAQAQTEEPDHEPDFDPVVPIEEHGPVLVEEQEFATHLSADDQQAHALQSDAQQPGIFQGHEAVETHNESFIPDQPPPSPPPPPEATYLSMQLSYLHSTLDNFTTYLAGVPAGAPNNAQQEVALALASADALAAQLRRLAQ